MNINMRLIIYLLINICALLYFITDPFASNDYTDETIGTIIQVNQTKQYSAGVEYIIYHSTIEFTDRYGITQTVLNDNKVIGAFVRNEKIITAVDLEKTKDYVGKTVTIAYNRSNPQHFKVGGFTSGDKLAYINPLLISLQIISILLAIYDIKKGKKN